MKSFEYKKIDKGNSLKEQELNYFGELGWELVHITQLPANGALVYYFKKEV